MRAITLTDTAWETLALLAKARGCSRSDLVEELAALNGGNWNGNARDEIIQQLIGLGQHLLHDKALTRGGKDRGVVRRTLQAVIAHLQTIPTTTPPTPTKPLIEAPCSERKQGAFGVAPLLK